MTELPGVSIIVNNHNYGRFVGAAILSALDQDHPETEVIAVDDGSTDGSRAVIAGFGAAIRTVFQANQGQVAACNAGWTLARHPLVIFLDADDMLTRDCASAVAAAWTPGVSKVQYRLSIIDRDGRELGHSFPKYPPRLDPATVRRELLSTGNYCWAPGSGNAYARSLLELLAPIEGERWLDDVLNSAAPLYGDVVTLDRPLALYRIHDANGSEQSSLGAARFRAYSATERRRVARIAEHCARLGVEFDGDAALARCVHHLEHRLVAAKLGRSGSGDAGRLGGLAWDAGRAILASSQSSWQRALRALWIVLVAALPGPVARRLIAMRYVATARPRLVEMAAAGLRRHRAGGEAGAAWGRHDRRRPARAGRP